MTIREVQVAQVTKGSQIRHPLRVHGAVVSHVNLFGAVFENPDMDENN